MKIHELTASELAGHIRSGEVSSEEAVRAYLDRIDAVDGRVGAYVHRFDEQALAQAREADARRARGEALPALHGVPISIKESMATAGHPVTLGIKNRLKQIEQTDAVTVRLLREAGAIVLGKTNVPQLLLCHETDNPIWGCTKNPWNLDRVPGGSSGGESAAIAAGMSPWGVGTDIGGSIRVPAAFCGIAGLKPTLDRWSNIGSHTAMMGQEIVRGQCGPMARTARDVALLFRAIDSPLHAEHDPHTAPLPTADPAGVDVRGLRVGFYVDDGYLAAAASQARGVREAARALEAAGATVVEFTPPAQRELMEVYFAALSSDGGATVRARLQGEPPIEQLKGLVRTNSLPTLIRQAAATVMGMKGEWRVQGILSNLGEKPVTRYWQLSGQRSSLRQRVLAAWNQAGVDVVLCPAHVTPALGHGHFDEFSPAGSYSMRYNLLNFPAGVVGVTRVRPDETARPDARDRLEKKAALVEAGSAGLPVGVQVVARPFREDLVLAAMVALEDAVRGREDFPKTPIL